jgi:hypothetical protein
MCPVCTFRAMRRDLLGKSNSPCPKSTDRVPASLVDYENDFSRYCTIVLLSGVAEQLRHFGSLVTTSGWVEPNIDAFDIMVTLYSVFRYYIGCRLARAPPGCHIQTLQGWKGSSQNKTPSIHTREYHFTSHPRLKRTSTGAGTSLKQCDDSKYLRRSKPLVFSVFWGFQDPNTACRRPVVKGHYARRGEPCILNACGTHRLPPVPPEYPFQGPVSIPFVGGGVSKHFAACLIPSAREPGPADGRSGV